MPARLSFINWATVLLSSVVRKVQNLSTKSWVIFLHLPLWKNNTISIIVKQFKTSVGAVQSHLKFSTIQGGSELHQQKPKIAPDHAYQMLTTSKKFMLPFLNCKPLKLWLRVFSASHIVAMVTHCVAKMIKMRSSMVGQFFETMIVASSCKEWW